VVNERSLGCVRLLSARRPVTESRYAVFGGSGRPTLIVSAVKGGATDGTGSGAGPRPAVGGVGAMIG
jgi:hypothetical protein